MTNQLNLEQTNLAFTEIANKAADARRVLFEAQVNHHEEPAVAAALVAGAISLLEQIGWMADRHGGAVLGDADQWMLPPAWHSSYKPE